MRGEAWVNPLLGLAKDSKLTLERFGEMQQEDIALENEIDRRRWLEYIEQKEPVCGSEGDDL